MKVLIVSGGKGSRLKAITGDLPKPLVPFGAVSLLELLIAQCVRYGFEEIHLLTGYNSGAIEGQIGDGHQLGARVVHHPEPEPLGTAGSIKSIEPLLGTEPFLVLYGDVFIDMDLGRLVDFHRGHAGVATLVVHPNDHPYDSDLIEARDDRIIAFHSKPRFGDAPYFNMVNAGAYVLDPTLLSRIPVGRMTDLGRDIFPAAVADGEAFYAYNTPEYLKDIGTPERYEHVLQDYLSGRCARRRLDQKRRAVFLDRDGTINEYRGLLCHPDEFRLLPSAAAGIRLLNHNDWLCVVTTNQPQLARGDLDCDGLASIHKVMEHQLGAEHAWIDATYFCPHHPDSGFEGEVPELKIKCDCRKPAGGMFRQAAERFNIDLTASYVIGDTTLDLAAARTIGARSILVETGLAGRDDKYQVTPDHIVPDLLAAAQLIIQAPS